MNMGLIDRLKEFGINVKRVFRVIRRPTAHEVMLIARVSGIGMLIVGGVAFLIQILGNIVNEFFKVEETTTTGAAILPIVNLLISQSSLLIQIARSLVIQPWIALLPLLG